MVLDRLERADGLPNCSRVAGVAGGQLGACAEPTDASAAARSRTAARHGGGADEHLGDRCVRQLEHGDAAASADPPIRYGWRGPNRPPRRALLLAHRKQEEVCAQLAESRDGQSQSRSYPSAGHHFPCRCPRRHRPRPVAAAIGLTLFVGPTSAVTADTATVERHGPRRRRRARAARARWSVPVRRTLSAELSPSAGRATRATISSRGSRSPTSAGSSASSKMRRAPGERRRDQSPSTWRRRRASTGVLRLFQRHVRALTSRCDRIIRNHQAAPNFSR